MNSIENLFYIQIEINNIIFVVIDYTFNEICYDFRVRNNLNLITNMSFENWFKLRLQYKKNAKKAIAWTNMIVKTYYNKKHKFINLKKKFKCISNFIMNISYSNWKIRNYFRNEWNFSKFYKKSTRSRIV